jgi:hypothetical protein
VDITIAVGHRRKVHLDGVHRIGVDLVRSSEVVTSGPANASRSSGLSNASDLSALGGVR